MINTIKKVLSPVLRAWAPGIEVCRNCGVPWTFTEPHVTDYMEECGCLMGCFPLCQCCWNSMTKEERLPFYRELFNEWEETSRKQWDMIKDSVMSGN